MHSDSQDIESATVTTMTANSAAPDAKTRRYDRQLRLWAATGQAALESARILVLGASATSTSILKNLVLPGIGHFTVLDHGTVSPADAGNNFFLEGPSSIGKSRAEEVVRLLSELNDEVEGRADTRDISKLVKDKESLEWIKGFTVVVAHNLEKALLHELSSNLWTDQAGPMLIVIRSAGFLAEFYIQFHEHQIIESHSETTPSLRIDKPFPALYEHAMSLDFGSMDPTDHGHMPYVFILVLAMEEWKKSHGGQPPQTYTDKQAFKKSILAMKVKHDEENFDEAEAQAYRSWTPTTIPSDIASLFSSPSLTSITPSSPPFDRLLAALAHFATKNGVLPLSPTLPDMKADTVNYIKLQNLYKQRAEEEKAEFRGYVQGEVDGALLDSFVKNAHALKVLKGKMFGAFDGDREGISNALAASPKPAVTHLALSALANFTASHPDTAPTASALITEIRAIVSDAELPQQELDEAVGELERAPNADLPNVAAFLGGIVAQEAIKMITKQYVPVNGYCVIDLIETWTGVVG